MPYIEIYTNIDTPTAAINTLHKRLGKDIEIMPGKSEKWLMINIIPNSNLCFAGDSTTSAAIAKVTAYGNAQSNDCYDKLTAAITNSINDTLSISADRIYVEFETTPQWGWNGKNFGR